MGRRVDVNRIGPYRLLCPLDPLAGWERWIALHERDDTDHVVYRHAPLHDAAERRRLLAQIEPIAKARHAHLLEVEAYSFDEAGQLCLVTPYTGNQEGLLTLDGLVQRRSGRLEVAEVARCVEHLLQGVAEARSSGLAHGPIDPARVLVDRRGSLRIELFGLPTVESGFHGVDSEADEVRSIAEIAVWLLTGLRQEVAPTGITRIAGRSAKPWESWLQSALDPVTGFDDAASALRALPSRIGSAPVVVDPVEIDRPRTPLSGVLRRFRKARSNAWDSTER